MNYCPELQRLLITPFPLENPRKAVSIHPVFFFRERC